MKILLTGIKPTGQAHLGNYIGAIGPALKSLKEKETQGYLFIADEHSLTSIQDAGELRHAVYDVACSWLACGLDPSKIIFYRQSDIPELFELYWILSCLTPKGLMNRAHSYKASMQAASGPNRDLGLMMGLYNYPILMAADILLFSADEVPVGRDQLQHLEMARDIAVKFNQKFNSNLMKEPQPLLAKNTVTLPGLDGRKMSKSYNNHIPLFGPSGELKKKIMKIKTDSSSEQAPKDPEKSIVFQIYSAFAGSEKSLQFRDEIKSGMGWGMAKQKLFVLLEELLAEKRKTYSNLMNDQKKVDQILKEGALKAREKSQEMMKKIRKTIGLSS